MSMSAISILFCRQKVSILPHAPKYLSLTDHHCKLKSELIGTFENSQKWMFFLQVVAANQMNVLI